MNIILPIAVLFPLASAIIGRLIKFKFVKSEKLYFIVATFIETAILGLIFYLQTKAPISFAVDGVLGLGLSFKADWFRTLYACISAFLWLMTNIFAKEYLGHDKKIKRYYFYNLITLCGVIGVFLSQDLYTTFVFFEVMSFASYPLVIHEEEEEAMKAGETYLSVSVISGMVLLVGLFFIHFATGTLNFEELRTYFETNELSNMAFAGGLLVLLGFGAKAGMYPLHVWLPKAHPVAPAPASALLSGILTKTGVFGIVVISANIFIGNKIFAGVLLTLAMITMFLGALLALFSTNLKRTLACSSMSQIGFILTGVAFCIFLGKEGGLAQNGALLHMANHSIIKLVLFMCAGVVAMNIHSLDLNEIRGYGRKKPFLMVIFLIGALSIMGIPLFAGYISKTMIHEAIVEFMAEEGALLTAAWIFKAVEWIFLISGGLTVAYMTKLFVCIFIEKNTDESRQKMFDEQKKYLSVPSKIVFVISAIPLLIIGILPQIVVKNITVKAYEFFGVEEFTHMPEFFGLESLKGGLISIAIGVIVYFAIVRTLLIRKNEYKNSWPEKLDLENLIYRPVLTTGNLIFIKYIVAPVAYFFEFILIKGTLYFILSVVRFIAVIFDKLIIVLNKTVLKAHVYTYKEESLSMRVGELMDKLFSKNNKHRFAEKMDSFTETFGSVVSYEYTSFSFAFAMISIGVIIILLFAIFG